MAVLPPLINALLQPQAYPDRPARIELVQTQVSFVFLTGEYAYKIKKPVDFGFLNFTTLEKRKYYCQQEVTLNSRLCPAIYRGVVGITREGPSYAVGGSGEPVEYAVKMRQLPHDRLLDHMLRQGTATPEMLERVAVRLAEFHARAVTSAEITRLGGLDTERTNNEENFAQTEKYINRTISKMKFEVIRSYTRRFLNQKAPLFLKRMAEGRVRDCHGDLHAAHVCFTEDICIFDCIEFNDRFRYSDVAADVAFLAMDLDFNGRSDLSRRFVDSYIKTSGDKESQELLDFFKCYRAWVRGKVESFEIDDPAIPEEAKRLAAAEASRYFDLAWSYALRPARPTLFITAGLIGAGKSTLAEGLARDMGLELLSSDVTRKKLAGMAPTERRNEGFNAGIYSSDFSRRTYEALFREARRLLESGRSVIIDASFRKSQERAGAIALARETAADFMVIHCVTSDAASLERLARRQKEQASASDGRPEIFAPIKDEFEALTDMPVEQRIAVDTSGPVEEMVGQAIKKIIGDY